MKSKTSVAVVAALLLAIAFGVAWFSFNSRRETEVSLVAVASRRAALDATVREAETKIASGEQERMAIQAVLQKLQAPKPARPLAAAPISKPPNENTVLASNPELFALYAKSFRAGLAQRYGLIYEALGLSPDQVAKLNDLFAQQDLEKMKLMVAAGSQGLDRSDPDVQALLQQLRDKYNAVRIELIGEPASQQFDHLLSTLPLTGMVNDAASFMALSSTPLTSSQEAQLLQILGNASSVDKGTAQADPATIRWDEALQQAQGILSAPQLAALKVEYQLSELGKANKQFYQKPPAPK